LTEELGRPQPHPCFALINAEQINAKQNKAMQSKQSSGKQIKAKANQCTTTQ